MRNRKRRIVGVMLCTLAVLPIAAAVAHESDDSVIYTYTLAHEATAASYDESMAVACLQGIVNRDAPRVYVLSRKNHRPVNRRHATSCGNPSSIR